VVATSVDPKLNKMENKNYHTIGRVPKSNKTILERDIFWFGTGTLITSCRVSFIGPNLPSL